MPNFKSFVDTALPVHEQEEVILRFWQEHHIFAKSQEQTKNGEPYVIYDGPPTANAKPPLHTIVPMSFKDLAGRFQTMKGRFVRRQAGWDTHGLPVEVQVEKALGLTSKKEVLSIVSGDETASIRSFNETCRKSVWEFKQEWDRFVPRVGYWVDTEDPYITYDPSYVEGVWGVFKKIWDKGLVYKDYKVVPYCPRCGTGLSAAEVAQEYQDIRDVSVYIRFPLLDTPGRAFLAWTTTPWTLPGNVGLAVGPDIEYVVVRQEEESGEQEYILAKSRLSILKGDYVILNELKGADLVGLQYMPPFPGLFEDHTGPKHEVIVADFVTTEDGTGIVHTAVMYGEDDFRVGKAAGLPMKHTVDLSGHFLPEIPEVGGLYVRDALGPILTYLQSKNALYAKQTITHSYPHCWRCKTPLVYYAKDSWYVAMSKLRGDLVTSNKAVNWVPDHIKEGRFGDFIREARDWAVSRERFWGSPMPVWTSENGDYLCVGSFAELKAFAKDPQAVGESFDPHRPVVDEITLIKDGVEYRREPVVLDVWFDSGAMPFASGRFAKGEFPADYIAEAIDQTRGWFNSLNNIGTILEGRAPYKTVVCMGHLVDEQGKKMSKSGPNALVPSTVFEQVGVDAIRWFLYTVNSPGEAKAFSIKEIQVGYRKSILLVQNMLNYWLTYANLVQYQIEDVKNAEITWLDRWVLELEKSVVQRVTSQLDEYDFMRAGRTLEGYINDLSTWYLRRSRKREDMAFYTVLRHVLLTLSKLMAPFVPFAAENVYQALRSPKGAFSVHLASWPTAEVADQKVLDEMTAVRQAVEIGLSVRSAEKMKVRQPLAKAVVEGLSLQEEAKQILADELNVLEVASVKAIDPGYVIGQYGQISVGLDTVLTEELIEAGLARELLRQIQQMRKNQGLQPGQTVTLLAGPYQRSLLEPLFAKYTWLCSDAFLTIDPEVTWSVEGNEEVSLNDQKVTLSLRP